MAAGPDFAGYQSIIQLAGFCRIGTGGGWVVWALLSKIYFRFFEVCTKLKDRAPASELVLLRGGLLSEIALQGEASSPKLCIEGLEVRIENDSDRIFSKSKFFHSILETNFLHGSF